MFRKGALPIAVLSAISTALFSWWVSSINIYVPNLPQYGVALLISPMYFIIFTAFWASIYDIWHKIKIKTNKYFLGCSISAVIAFTAFLKGLEYSNKILGFIFVIALVCLIILGNIGTQYEEADIVKEEFLN